MLLFPIKTVFEGRGKIPNVAKSNQWNATFSQLALCLAATNHPWCCKITHFTSVVLHSFNWEAVLWHQKERRPLASAVPLTEHWNKASIRTYAGKSDNTAVESEKHSLLSARKSLQPLRSSADRNAVDYITAVAIGGSLWCEAEQGLVGRLGIWPSWSKRTAQLARHLCHWQTTIAS